MNNIDQLLENLFGSSFSDDVVGGITYNRIVPDVNVFPINTDFELRSLMGSLLNTPASQPILTPVSKSKPKSNPKQIISTSPAPVLSAVPVEKSIVPLIPEQPVVQTELTPRRKNDKQIAPVVSMAPITATQQDPVTKLAFTLNDFSRSYTASKYKIDNSIPTNLEENANQMLAILSDIQEKWGSKIILNSGYRTKALNDKLKGSSKTSAHMSALAMDIKPANGKFKEFTKFMKDYVKDKDFDQLIIESSNSGKSKWIHFGLKASGDRQRKQIFNINM